METLFITFACLGITYTIINIIILIKHISTINNELIFILIPNLVIYFILGQTSNLVAKNIFYPIHLTMIIYTIFIGLHIIIQIIRHNTIKQKLRKEREELRSKLKEVKEVSEKFFKEYINKKTQETAPSKEQG